MYFGDAQGLACCVSVCTGLRSYSIQNELIPALVRRQFGGMAGGGKPVPKRQDGMAREVVSGEALVARATR